MSPVLGNTTRVQLDREVTISHALVHFQTLVLDSFFTARPSLVVFLCATAESTVPRQRGSSAHDADRPAARRVLDGAEVVVARGHVRRGVQVEQVRVTVRGRGGATIACGVSLRHR